MWYEWANTNRHQYPADPLQNWLDAPLPNFSETFVTNSYQPFAEYQLHITSKLSITPGVKFAYYTIGTKQFADNGGKIGPLAASAAVANPKAFIANGGSYFSTLPSATINYRILSNWSDLRSGRSRQHRTALRGLRLQPGRHGQPNSRRNPAEATEEHHLPGRHCTEAETKIRLSFNSLFNQSSITGDGITGTAQTMSIAGNNITYSDPFNTNGQTPIAGGDNVSILPGRSIVLSIQFGLSPKR